MDYRQLRPVVQSRIIIEGYEPTNQPKKIDRPMYK